MAATVAKIGRAYGYALKVDNQDMNQLNLIKEYHDVTFDSGTVTAEITTNLKTILNMQVVPAATTTVGFFSDLIVTSGAVTFTVTGTANLKFRVELTGLSS